MKYSFDRCEFDTARLELSLDGSRTPVEPQAFRLLKFLLENRDRVVSKDDLIEAVWQGRIISDAALNSCVSAARQAVGDSGQQQTIIRTIPRRGYRFVATVQIADADEDGAGPDNASDAASQRLNGQSTSTHKESRAWDLQNKPTLAVLPFEDISESLDQAYLVDGIVEDLITDLSKNRWLLILSRNSTYSLRTRKLSTREITTELGADYLVGGSIRKSGDRIRINVRLIECASGGHIWDQRYDRKIANIFDLQEEIAETIAARIEPELAGAEQHRAKSKPTKNLDAWDLYLLGQAQMYTFQADGNGKAKTFFRQAIELDPEFSQAYARLAYAIVLSMVYFDAAPETAMLDEALAIARKAVVLDDQDAVSYFCLGRVHLARGEYESATRELELSLQLNPCLAVTYCGLGDALTYSDRLDEAVTQFEEAIRLSPLDPYRWGFFAYRSLSHLFGGDYEPAVKWARTATEVPNAQFWAFAHLVSALGYLGPPEEADSALQVLMRLQPNFSCSFARRKLFFISNEKQIEIYIEGLHRSRVPA